ncbi:MAG TPA: hypothetical protein VGC93_00490 [Thermoanaerobaculia bacterium]
MTSPSEPTPQPTSPSFAELLARLRLLENQLYSSEVVEQAKQLPDDEKQSFASGRIHLTTLITELNTAELASIREQLEAEGAALVQGIDDLNGSLARLENANSWAQALNGVIGLLGKVVPLL